jgi:hypothetical protein
MFRAQPAPGSTQTRSSDDAIVKIGQGRLHVSTPAVVSLLSLCMLVACGRESPEGLVTERDSTQAGYVFVRNHGGGSWTTSSRWTVQKVVSFVDDSTESFDLTGAAAIAVDSRRFVHVLLWRQSKVYTFDSLGRFVRTIGRAGAGPGEMRVPSTLAIGPGDSLWVVDDVNRRYVVFDTAGAFVRTTRRPLIRNCRPNPCTWFETNGTLRDGSLVVDGPSVFRNRIFRQSGTGHVTDSIILPTADSVASASIRPIIPFSPSLVYAFDQAGVVWFGLNDRYRITGVRAGGDTALIIERARERVPVTASEWDDAARASNHFARSTGVPPASHGALSNRYKPAFGQLAIDPDGFIWVVSATQTDGLANLLEVFHPNGTYLGDVRLLFDMATTSLAGPWREPAPMVVTATHIYALSPSPDERLTLVRAAIRKPGQ